MPDTYEPISSNGSELKVKHTGGWNPTTYHDRTQPPIPLVEPLPYFGQNILREKDRDKKKVTTLFTDEELKTLKANEQSLKDQGLK